MSRMNQGIGDRRKSRKGGARPGLRQRALGAGALPAGALLVAAMMTLAMGCQNGGRGTQPPATAGAEPASPRATVPGGAEGEASDGSNPGGTETAAAGTTQVAREMNADTIRDAVEHELMLDPAVPFDDIDVKVANGIVTFEGKVGSILAKERAAKIAQIVRGIRSVINKIRVEPDKATPDPRLRLDVKRALSMDPATNSYAVDVAVKDGVVKLTGSVGSWQQKQLAEVVTKGVNGVRGVENEVDVRYEEDRTDQQILAEVEGALRWNTLVDDGLVNVAVKDGHVRLLGTVASAAEKSEAWTTAWVTGVKSVDTDGLEVTRWARDPDLRKGKYVHKPDGKIRGAIMDTLALDPRVSGFDLGVSVVGGVVTLRGIVDNPRARASAESDARRTVGVRSVVNQLKVRPVTETDTVLAARLRQAFVLDPVVDRYDLQASVHDGDVYLSGLVRSYYEKLRAKDVAERIRGVHEVVNRIEVNPGEGIVSHDPYLDATYRGPEANVIAREPRHARPANSTLRELVELELWWSPFINEDRIEVEAKEGTVTLTGTVGSMLERDLASMNAFQAGTTWVRNQLVVEQK